MGGRVGVGAQKMEFLRAAQHEGWRVSFYTPGRQGSQSPVATRLHSSKARPSIQASLERESQILAHRQRVFSFPADKTLLALSGD
jgi:hypothetical protein